MTSAIPSLAKQRRLHIIDDVTPLLPGWDKKNVERLHFDKQGAERIIIGDESSTALGQWVQGCEDILLDNLQFALPPFPKTYIEMTIRGVHQGLGRPTSGSDETADDRIGFLIVGKHVRTVVSARDRSRTAMGLFEYWLDTPDPESIMDKPRSVEDFYRVALLLGSTHHELHDTVRFDYLARNTRIRCSVVPPEHQRQRVMRHGQLMTRLQSFVEDAAGEMRTLWAALLIINQHQHRIQSRTVPRETLITARGRKVYLGHTLITIPMSASPAEARKTFYPNTRQSPVGHRVKAHWRDYHERKDCTAGWPQGMQWPLFPDEEGHFQCPHCNGYRRRIESFHRGRSDLGYNLHTYEVKA